MAKKDSFIKITEANMEEKSLNKHIMQMCDSSKTVFNEIYDQITFDLVACMQNCESPIEQIMALRLHNYKNSWQAYKLNYQDNIDVVDIQNQYIVKVGSISYRIDFAIPVWDMHLHKGAFFAIECDGHDFHEKTKEQAQRDKKRDRDITTSGMIIMRFTGSEIYRNQDIADEIFQNIKSIMVNRRNGR